MSSNIKIKRSETSGNPAVLGSGELAYSALTDNGSNGGDRLYIGTGTETAGNAVNHVVIGGKYFTDIVSAATNTNTISTLVKRDSSGNFAANAITASSFIGDLTGVASSATKWVTARTLSLTGDGTATLASVDGTANVSAAFTLKNTGTAGTYNNITTDAQGRVVSGTLASYLTTNQTISLSGDATGSGTTAITVTLPTINSNIGTFNNVTVNGKGLVTSASNVAYLTSIAATGDATGSSSGSSIALTLANVNSNVGTFGSTTAIPVVTVNAKGLVTSVTTAAISSSLSIAGGTGTDTVAVGTDTLTFAGGTGVATTVTNNQVSFAIGQAVAPTDNVTFNSVTVNGTLTSDDITSSNISVTGNATITGNLTVQGTTTTINSTSVAVADLNITLAKDATTAAAANGAGLTVTGPTTPATVLYVSADDSWTFNKDIRTSGSIYGNIIGTITGVASSANKWETARNLSLTGDATATLASVDGTANVSATLTLKDTGTAGSYNNVTTDAKGRVTSGSTVAYLTSNENITVSGDASGSGTTAITITLPTVNSNVGSFGTATSVPAVTVNAKGLVTAVTTNAIPTATNSVLGLASFATADFTVTSGVVTIKAIDGGTY